jgi:hypothetical protein
MAATASGGQAALPPGGAQMRVVLLSDDLQAAQAAVAALRLAIAAHPEVDSNAFDWLVASNVPDAAGSDICLLLSWDESRSEASGQGLAGLQAHQALRQALLAQQQPFTVLRGTPMQQVQQALAALARRHAALMPAGAQTLGRPGWQSLCEKCDDPQCEHRLLSQLLERKAASRASDQPT